VSSKFVSIVVACSLIFGSSNESNIKCVLQTKHSATKDKEISEQKIGEKKRLLT